MNNRFSNGAKPVPVVGDDLVCCGFCSGERDSWKGGWGWEQIAFESLSWPFLFPFSHSHGLPVINAQSLLLLLGDCQATAKGSGLGLSSSRMGAKCLIAILGPATRFQLADSTCQGSSLLRSKAVQFVLNKTPLWLFLPYHYQVGMRSWQLCHVMACLEIRPFDTSRWWESLGQLWLRVKQRWTLLSCHILTFCHYSLCFHHPWQLSLWIFLIPKLTIIV